MKDTLGKQYSQLSDQKPIPVLQTQCMELHSLNHSGIIKLVKANNSFIQTIALYEILTDAILSFKTLCKYVGTCVESIVYPHDPPILAETIAQKGIHVSIDFHGISRS